MSRTTRNRHFWNWLNGPTDWIDDIRNAFVHGRDGKPCSLLYADYIKQPGWSRDYYNGIAGRRFRKKQNRRYQRRQAEHIIQEVWE